MHDYFLLNALCFHGVFGLLPHNLHISIIVLHHVHCFLMNWVSIFNVQTVF